MKTIKLTEHGGRWTVVTVDEIKNQCLTRSDLGQYFVGGVSDASFSKCAAYGAQHGRSWGSREEAVDFLELDGWSVSKSGVLT